MDCEFSGVYGYHVIPDTESENADFSEAAESSVVPSTREYEYLDGGEQTYRRVQFQSLNQVEIRGELKALILDKSLEFA